MYLHHHCVIVQDMDEALKIFCDYLGMKLVKRVEGFGDNLELAFIEEPKTGHQIELFSRLPVDIKNQGLIRNFLVGLVIFQLFHFKS